ncbi:MAG: protein kinase [Gammaproteobacteria bacterium]|nr:protein kinase [Gammaproteobacteria bacterium]
MTPAVLIIDDHEEFRELLAHHIGAEWPRARIVHHDVSAGPAAAQLLEEFDVVLLDYRLGEDNGLDWLGQMRTAPDCPPVIFLTASGDEMLAVRAIKAGAHDYLPKSRMTNALLINSIRDAMRSRNLFSQPAKTQQLPQLQAVGANLPEVRGYHITKLISERGPSSIYLAQHEGMEVALKVLRNADEIATDKLERFLHECDVIADMQHPNIVRIYDHGVADEVVYLAMEYFPRGDLKAWLARGFSAPLAIECTRQIATALSAIHALGILHRDLKPANVMVREDHSVALIDFGHAKQMWLEAALTDPGEIFGTPYYMSPEQGQGRATDHRSDIYSVGAMLFELLTGRKPYTATSPMAVLYKHGHAAVPELPPTLAAYQPLISRMMAKDPADRFQNARELLLKLDATAKITDTSVV